MNKTCNKNINQNIDDLLYLSLACCQVAYLPFDTPNYEQKFYKFINNACPKFNIKLLHKGQKKDQEYIICSASDFILITFRGSDELFTKAGLIDWKVNATAKIVDIPKSKFKAHEGFLNSAISVYIDILNIFKKYMNNKKIIITGHSKGGPVAQLIAFMLKYYDNLICNFLITFGSPRPFYGKEVVKYMCDNFSNRTIHVETDNDAVCSLPPNIFFWSDWSVACPNNIVKIESSNPVTAHGQNNYVYGLNLMYGCNFKDNICGCPKNLDLVPFIPGGGLPRSYKENNTGYCSK